MVTKCAVINASPLIFLSRGNQLSLLQHFAQEVIVPEPVAREIRARGADDVSAVALVRNPWPAIAESVAVPAAIYAWGLGMGESSVLAHAFHNPGMVAIIDDLAARRCAVGLQVPVRSTLGIVLAAKRRGLIPSARSVMEDLIAGGLYLSPGVLSAALQRVNE